MITFIPDTDTRIIKTLPIRPVTIKPVPVGYGDVIPPVSLEKGFMPLKRGSRGRGVELLQRWLNVLGYGLKVDGIFGPRTEAALKSFQRSVGLNPDGWAGKLTWNRLEMAVKGRIPPKVVEVKPAVMRCPKGTVLYKGVCRRPEEIEAEKRKKLITWLLLGGLGLTAVTAILLLR